MSILINLIYKRLSLAFVLTIFSFQLCNAQLVHENIPVTGGQVSSMVRDGNTIYIGGNFWGLGPNVPNGSCISTTTGQPNLNYVKPNDEVTAVVSDGAVAGILVGNLPKLVVLPGTI